MVTNRQNMLLGLLQLVDASGGEIESRIVLQKEAFLLARLGYPHISTSNFSYHHFGPFSRELSDYLQFATSSGLLKERASPGMNDGIKYSYSLTEMSKQYLKDAGAMEGKYAHLVSIFKKQHWRTLELAATALFLESREKKDVSAAFDAALQLKPDTRPYKDNAQELLKSLS